jgi:trimeric autotransporter adhesin
MKGLTISLVMCMILATQVVPALGDALQDIPLGGTVFIGEENLNLLGIPSGTTLTWYTGTQVIGRSAPSATITIADNASFYVSPSDFVRRTGNWYIGNSDLVGFAVSDPSETISVFNQESGKDITNKSVQSGDFLTFRVETNMNVIPAQRPSDDGFITIRVRAPDGTLYTGLCQDENTTVNLADLAPDAMPWYWVPLEPDSEEGWSTGFRGPGHNLAYPSGLYAFWTESRLNGMKDNYKDVSGNDFTGKTVSAVQNVTIESDSVHIVIRNDTVVRGDAFSVTITGKPDGAYYLWVKDTSSMSGLAGDQPPSILGSQDNVRMDPKAGPWPIGRYVFEGSTRTIQQDVAQFYGRENVKGVVYYALVTLDSDGSRTVGFSTTVNTKDDDYTIHVERPEPYDPPASDSGPRRTFRTGDVDVTVEKGTMEVHDYSAVRGARTYFLGEEITLAGTSTGSNFTYLFITGPNLPGDGGQMSDPGKPVDMDNPESFARAEVINQEWEYTWQTANLNIDTGAYTIYAVGAPVDKTLLTIAEYSTVSVIIKQPFVSALASPPVVASGDRLFVRGIAAGQPENGVAVWIFGKNKIMYLTPGVNADGTFEQEISPGTTSDMAPGQYFVVVQHPMYNEVLDVWPTSPVADFYNKDLVVGSYPVYGNTLFRLQGEGSLMGPDAADALVQALNNPGIDDIYAKLEFLLEVPQITILPVDEKQVGDKFPLRGTTNLATGDTILVQVTSSSFQPTTKTQSGEFSGLSGTATVRKGADGLNTWSFPVDAAAFRPDEYIVSVSGVTVDAQVTTQFNVVEYNPATHRAIAPEEADMTEPGTLINDTTPANSTTVDEIPGVGSGKISVGTKESRLVSTIVSKPAPAPATVVTTPQVINATTTTLPGKTTPPTTRPTAQPGFGAVIALGSLATAAFHVVRKH